jgi:hypothetical protein
VLGICRVEPVSLNKSPALNDRGGRLLAVGGQPPVGAAEDTMSGRGARI